MATRPTPLPLSDDNLASALPDVTRSFQVDGLEGQLDIYRDRYGIPHVTAQCSRDAFFGQGFATAQDRLWHMDVDRHRASGRWAEFVGQAGLDSDIMMRQFRIAATAKDDYTAVDAETKAMADAYADGVNAFIQTTETLPIEYQLVEATPEPWQPWDAFSIFKMRHIFMGIFEGKLWRARLVNQLGPDKAAQLMKGYEPGHLVIVPPGHVYNGPVLDALNAYRDGLHAISWLQETPESGSNNWAISGTHTASGKPLLAGDPHRALDTPNVYYQNHIACPDFDVIGLSFPGVPGFPHFGHNAHTAWCITHAQADYQDLYVERFHPDDPTQYEFQEAWQPADIYHETIQVKGGSPHHLEITATHHGPIISGNPRDGQALAFRYTATAEPNLGFESIRHMLTATDTTALDASMQRWVDPGNNLVSADVHGNIAYLNRGKIPIRSMANAWLPVPGWTGEHEWEGHIPFDQMARAHNPEGGLIVTANNRIVGHDYPYYLSLDNAPEYRARRIWDRLEALTSATVEDMQAIHADRLSIPARIYLNHIAALKPTNAMVAQAQQLLMDWDGSMDPDAVAPTIYSAFRRRLMRLIVDSLLGETLTEEMFHSSGRGAPVHLRQLAVQMNAAARCNDTDMLPPGQSWASVVSASLSHAVADLQAQLGDAMETWSWGAVHRTSPQHVLSAFFPEAKTHLNPPAMSLGGDFDTPLAGSYSPGGDFTIVGMSVARYVFDLADWDQSQWIVPLGASGHPGSPHYADQAPIWAEVNLVPMTYSWETIQAEAESHQQLRPTP